ncbi:MAG TPA: malto-oligosyltrehalose synthase [Rhizomicrobium sp.]|nr:malto-oligosyltrehalose synthase [Rhizomicrobium sp.]
MIPRATYRLQFRKEFTFAHASALVPYFNNLGVSHVYASPILAARKGSSHGYDVIDHSRINPELGGEDEFRAFVACLRRHEMGIIVDIVPNHMAVAVENAWWMNMLELGRDSMHARAFDVDWDGPDPSLKNRILLPILGKPFAQALTDSDIDLVRDESSGKIAVAYAEHRLPLRPADAQMLAGASLEQFRSAATMAALLDRQHYRLAWWRTAGDLINWRRFFDINDLIALRVEDDAVFDAVHAKHLALYSEGLIDGFRVDHVDGLADPAAYCRKLRGRMNALRTERGYMVVEKILGQNETLPREWDVDGTTGYDFMNDVSALLHDPRGAEPLEVRWTAISGRAFDFETEERRARRERLEVKFRSAFEAAARAFFEARPGDARDMTLASQQRALARLYAQLRVYRSYATGDANSAAAGALFQDALERARYRAAENDAAALAHVTETLEGRAAAPVEPRRIAARRFNQLAAALAAKAGEDTAFYRYGRLLSRNEVGSDPGEFAISVAEFHARAQRRLGSAPLLAGATHDNKRGEDVRARLAVISEIPGEWSAAVDRWFGYNARLRDPQLDPGDEYQLYQTLVGSWPLGLAWDHGPALSEFCERILGWRLKSLHEEKIHTSWGDPDARYDRASGAFVRQLLDPECSADFLHDLTGFIHGIAPAAATNGISQAVLRCTCPGVPDLYQGTEFWDLSMVDPDNRRAVDFASRAAALAKENSLPQLLAEWRNGVVKQALIARLLALRRECDDCFARGDYLPAHANGPRKDHVVAFLRCGARANVLIAAPRLCARACIESRTPLPSSEYWTDTELTMPRVLAGKMWRDALDPTRTLAGEEPRCAELFAHFPAAVLISD